MGEPSLGGFGGVVFQGEAKAGKSGDRAWQWGAYAIVHDPFTPSPWKICFQRRWKTGTRLVVYVVILRLRRVLIHVKPANISQKKKKNTLFEITY